MSKKMYLSTRAEVESCDKFSVLVPLQKSLSKVETDKRKTT